MNKVLEADILPTSQRLELVHGDLTQERVDAIRNYFEVQENSHISQIRITLFDEETMKAFYDIWKSRGFSTQQAP